MKIASWNVNSLKVRLPHVLTWLESEQPDALGLQELKMDTPAFPHEAFQALGYEAYVWGQKTYNGVAWLIKKEIATQVQNVSQGFAHWNDTQARSLTLHLNSIDLTVWYVPNGQSLDSEKYLYKLEWLQAAQQHTTRLLNTQKNSVVVGDFNIAPADADVYDPLAWGEGILCSPQERTAWNALLYTGFHDSFRHFPQPDKSYTWWDYRQGGFRRNHGLRIDHILVSETLLPYLQKSWIDAEPRSWERPSDHAPILIELSPF